MNVEHPPRRVRGGRAVAIVCALLLALLAFVLVRSRPNQARQSLIRVDSNGTARLGPLPLRNTNLRDAAFIAVAHLNNGTADISAAQSAKMSDFIKTLDAMQRAGITSLTLRTESPPSANPTTRK